MIDDIFVFDCVVHLHDMSDLNLRHDVPSAEASRALAVGLGEMLRPLSSSTVDYATRISVEEMHRLVFEQSPTDMAMAQTVPLFDWFEDWWAPAQLQYEMAAAYPDKVLFCGGVDPSYRGLSFALEDLERQITELGAVSLKFYNGHLERTWRCDDEKIAYPIYERARDLGVTVLQFHKGLPFGQQNVESVRPNDLQKAARDFPEISFVVHHLAVPYFPEMVAIASRFPNIHLALSANLCFLPIAPRLVQEQVGVLLQQVGSDRLIYGSEAGLAGSPAPYLDAFMNLEIPEDLRVGFGYPQLTHEDKKKILGENFARLLGIDLDLKKRELGLPVETTA